MYFFIFAQKSFVKPLKETVYSLVEFQMRLGCRPPQKKYFCSYAPVDSDDNLMTNQNVAGRSWPECSKLPYIYGESSVWCKILPRYMVVFSIPFLNTYPSLSQQWMRFPLLNRKQETFQRMEQQKSTDFNSNV